MHLSPSQAKIIDYLNDGEWHCMANPSFFIKDDRKRLSELREKGYGIESKECDGRCGVQHNARLLMRRLVHSPVTKPAPKFEPRCINGVWMAVQTN